LGRENRNGIRLVLILEFGQENKTFQWKLGSLLVFNIVFIFLMFCTFELHNIINHFFVVLFYRFGCKYVDRNQWDYFTKGLWVLFNKFSLFHMKEFLNEIFCNLFFKIHIVAPIDHMFCVKRCWINMNFSKCVNFVRFHVAFWKFIIILNHTKIS
jgi:hypothetical protein